MTQGFRPDATAVATACCRLSERPQTGVELAMPRRAASRAAWPRLPTPSLRRIADTWWCTVFSDRNSRAAISALDIPSASSASTSTSRRVSRAGLVSVSRRGPRGTPRAPRVAQPPGHDRRQRAGAEALELGQRPAQLVLVGRLDEGQRGVVGAVRARPTARRRARCRRSAGTGTARRRAARPPGCRPAAAARPVRRAPRPTPARRPRRRRRRVASSTEARVPGRARRPRPAPPPPARGTAARTVPRTARPPRPAAAIVAGVAAPQPDQPERGQPENPQQRHRPGRAGAPHVGVGGRVVPPAAVEVGAGPVGQDVEPPALQPEFRRTPADRGRATATSWYARVRVIAQPRWM